MARWKLIEGLVALGSLLTLAGVAFGQSAAGDSVDVTVTHAVIDAAGQATGPAAPPVAYRLERVRTDTGWKTVMTYRPVAGSTAKPSILDRARVEYDESTGRLQIRDGDGRAIDMPASEAPAGPLPAWTGQSLLDSLEMRPDGKPERLELLEETFGRARGKVRGLDRFLANRDDEITEEVLADPETSAPVEINTARGGRLEQRIVFEYEKRPGGALRRRSMRSESLIPDSDGRRVVTVVSFAPAGAGR